MSDYEKVILLDLTGCKYLGELHQRIKKAFDFPDWYGENWDAFWDLLREPVDKTYVEVRGMNSLPDELKSSGAMILSLLQDNKEWQYDFDYKVID